MQFNAAAVLANQPVQESAELLPEGKYGLVCTESIIKPSKNDPANQVLHTTWKVVIPVEHKDRKVKAFFNVVHSNTQVQEIAWINLANCCAACGLSGEVGDLTVDLLGKKVVGHITIKGKTASYAYDSNIVKSWKAPTTQGASQQAAIARAEQSYGPAPTNKVMPVPVMPAVPVNLQAMDEDIPF